MSTIVFILDSISQPRCIKRIKSFTNRGYDVEVYGIDRGKYNLNATIDGIDINVIGNQEQGARYLSKLIDNNREIRSMLKKYPSESTIYYSFGFALTLSLYLNGCKRYIYEIADILYGYKKFNHVRWLFKLIDKVLIRKSILTIFTSAGFVNFLFRNDYRSNLIIQPNKLDSSFLHSNRPDSKDIRDINKIVFAFIGGFRSPNTIFRFARIIGEKYPNHEFYFYGDSILKNEVIEMANSFQNVKYFGPFRNPEDLHRIYSNVDLVVSSYDTQTFNEQILEPNKLYEALYFRKPIIVSKNTYLSKKVDRLGCGFSIDASNDVSIISFVESINMEDIKRINRSIKEIPIEEIVDDSSEKIISFLKGFGLKKK